MIPKSLHPIIFLTLLLTITLQTHQVSDFTYSQLQVQEQHSQSKRIRLTPQRSVLDRWEFPNTWEIREFLTQSLEKQDSMPQISNIDGEVAFLKEKVGQFLRLSNKAELLVRNIQQLPQMKHDPTLDVQEVEFAVLEEQQAKLKEINDQINEKGIELERIVRELMIQQENPLFKQAALNFQKKALTQKIALFRQLLQKSTSQQQSTQQNTQRLTQYFTQLDKIFTTQSGLIDAIDTLLKTHNSLTLLKARVTSLTSQLKAHDLTLTEKQQCAQEFTRIIQKQSHDRQVIKLVETLKQKKLQFNQPNKYCEGVVIKLVERVKKLLVGYDYVFECARDLEEVRGNREMISGRLEQAQRSLDQMQLEKGVEQFRKNFETNRAVIANKVKELKTLELDDYHLTPGHLQSAITQAHARITQIDRLLSILPTQSTQNLPQIQHQITTLVTSIKSLKASYCQQNQAYVHNSRLVEDVLRRLEQQEGYNEWVRQVEVEKLAELEAVKGEMREIGRELRGYLLE